MDLAKHWRLRGPRYRLEGQRNVVTGEVRFPPEPDSPADWKPHTLRGSGTLYSYSLVRQTPDGYEQPYAVALVALDDGPMITAQLTDCDVDQLRIGMPLEMVTRKLRDLGPDGLIVYGYKFRPLLG